MPSSNQRADWSRAAGRIRDRHGRGLRGPLLPPDGPGHRSRAEQFAAEVARAQARLAPAWAKRLASVRISIADVPPLPTGHQGPVPLGQVQPASSDGITTLLLFRRPIVDLARDPQLLGPAIYRVLVELSAELFSIDPEDIDEQWDQD